MPIQNIGTLLENMVVTEAAAVLVDRLSAGQDLRFVTAFAMPALSEWRSHRHCVGISPDALRQIAEAGGRSEFIDMMSRCLRHFPDQGPNASLLVSLVTTHRGAGLRIWANDIPNGHYGNAIPSLHDIPRVVREILPECKPSIDISVCDVAYPLSLDLLEKTLQAWGQSRGALLGFLDPMRYVRDSMPGPYTHPSDHRRWLSILREWSSSQVSLAVHFTANNDWNSRRDELEPLRKDLIESGFPFWLEIGRQHYVVSVGSRHKETIEALESRVTASWSEWCERVSEIKNRSLKILRSWDSDPRFANLKIEPDLAIASDKVGYEAYH
jgi:hypothetical protein